jgi:hypothetical protein
MQFGKIISIKSVGVQKFYDLESPKYHNYIANGIVNHNSGKDMLAAIMHCYATYILLCMKNPHKYFDWPESEAIDILNVAYSADQAASVYFVKFRERVKRWKWLRDNFCIYQEGKIITPMNVGKPLVKIFQSGYISFPHLIRAVSESSENESFEGYNILWWIMDEASAFKNKGGLKRNAHKVYETLRSSATSRFGKFWKGSVLSWPRQEVNDFTMEMYKVSQTDPSIYGDFGCTWQIKPARFYSGVKFEFEGELIPIEFEDDFRLEPEMSKCKYMCRPQKVQGAFFSYTGRIRECIDRHGRLPIFDTEDIIVQHEMVDELGNLTARKDFVGKRISMFRVMGNDLSIPRVAHVDGGLTSDAAGLVVAHGVPVIMKIQNPDTGEYQSVTMNKLVVDGVVRWIPDPHRHLQVSLNNVEGFLLDLVEKGIKFKKISYDQWNSQTSLERLMSHRIHSEMHTISTRDYCELRTMVYAGGVDLLPWQLEADTDPYWMLTWELEHLINFGVRIDHPDNGSKDLADGLAGVNRLLNDIKAKEDVFRRLPSSVGATMIGSGKPIPLGAEQVSPGISRQVFEGMPGMGSASRANANLGRPDKLIELRKEEKDKFLTQPGKSLPRARSMSSGRGAGGGVGSTTGTLPRQIRGW